MHFQIIIPAHNEERYLPLCLQSLLDQSYKGWKCLVVDDGSSDRTWEIIQEFSFRDARISGVQRPKSDHHPGAKVVESFEFGFNQMPASEIVCKFDADVSFPPNYLSELAFEFEKDSRLGMCSGLVFIQKNGQWIFESISSKNHIRGPIKAYRRAALEAMGGLKKVLGWDNLDVILTEKAGYTTRTRKDLKVRHYRPTAFAYRDQKYQKLGIYFRNLGLDFPLAMVSMLKVFWKDRAGLTEMLKSFLKAPAPAHLSQEEIRFIRRWRWKKLLSLQRG